VQKKRSNAVILIIGGVRSGKSRYAQQLAEQSTRVTFVATAERRDDEEMHRKIERHRAERPAHWATVEEPIALGRVIQASENECDAILIDCLTLFGANLMETCGSNESALEASVEELCTALKATTRTVILVSNEVGSGVVPAYALGRRFRDIVGEINQRVTAVADTVLLMVATSAPSQRIARRRPSMKGFLVAGTASGVGKTTVTLAIIAALRRRGYTVQPFKGGPDFLDTGHHTRISGRTARNLDTWMLSAEANRDVLRQASQGAEVLLVEGMMGLFDGKDGATQTGSSAEIAKLLKLPVVLVLDAGKTARSIAAVVLGFELFDPELPLAGVILNRVASDRHFCMLEVAIRSACRTPVLGWLPPEPTVAIPERHLGLHSVEESESGEALGTRIDTFAGLAEKHLDISRLLDLECGLNVMPGTLPVGRHTEDRVRIGVARDQAFPSTTKTIWTCSSRTAPISCRSAQCTVNACQRSLMLCTLAEDTPSYTRLKSAETPQCSLLSAGLLHLAVLSMPNVEE